jgi:hypothetical protein
MHGRSINIFLVDGTPTGLRTVEVSMSTIKAVIAPRPALKQLYLRDEAARTGIYLLLGEDPEHPGRLLLYVGEGDDVVDRIRKHEATKTFWDSVILFVSKDDNLTKAHVRWLEARLVALASEAKRAQIENKTVPEGGVLPESARSDMLEYIDQVQLILGALGFDLFALEKVVATAEKASPGATAEFLYSGDGFSARCVLENDLFVVKAGSKARATEASTLQPPYQTMRRFAYVYPRLRV